MIHTLGTPGDEFTLSTSTLIEFKSLMLLVTVTCPTAKKVIINNYIIYYIKKITTEVLAEKIIKKLKVTHRNMYIRKFYLHARMTKIKKCFVIFTLKIYFACWRINKIYRWIRFLIFSVDGPLCKFSGILFYPLSITRISVLSIWGKAKYVF